MIKGIAPLSMEISILYKLTKITIIVKVKIQSK
jgi:hypothetical protein